jgi:hypothetical protein
LKSKTEILDRANREFSEHWKFLRKANPRMRLPDRETFPTVSNMTIGEISHEFGTEAELTLEIKTEEGEVLQLKGACFDSHHDSSCEFVGIPRDLKEFADAFALNLLFNILCEERLELEDWQNLPE